MNPVGEVLQQWHQSSNISIPTGAVEWEPAGERLITEYVGLPAGRHE